MSIQCQHNLPRETCWMCNATTRLANAGITTPTNDDLIKELARQVADLREQLVAARAEREHFKNCISAREVRAMVDERNKAWSNLADARILSEVMEQGVLRMSPELWTGDPLDVMQRHAHYVAAADELERLRKERDHFRDCISAREVRALVDERDKLRADLAAARADAERLRHDLNDMRAGHEVLARQVSISRALLVECAQAVQPPWQNPDDPLWSLKNRINSTFSGQSEGAALAGEKK